MKSFGFSTGYDFYNNKKKLDTNNEGMLSERKMRDNFNLDIDNYEAKSSNKKMRSS